MSDKNEDEDFALPLTDTITELLNLCSSKSVACVVVLGRNENDCTRITTLQNIEPISAMNLCGMASSSMLADLKEEGIL